ncbi:non-homologous end-joining DNA ligase [Motilibacter aurantiacus]|uniref:non-homologous end-joining DNA ligase n=1 Tax=Motilibacter aurantiacus TaxID=2714955 RepID=UPI001408FB82|nr:DNA ligase [Motilibacter aurantiacus]
MAGKDKLSTYRSMRSADRTPEPVPAEGPLPEGNDDTFVIQEHHATALHWDFRLERDGVLVSWAVPKGLPTDPKRNHLAVHTEDHPLEYASFAGEIPHGEYGGGQVHQWARGTYETVKWTDREVQVVLHGGPAEIDGAKFVLFATGGKNWMVHRMSPAPAAVSGGAWAPLPELIKPMLATAGPLPPARDDDQWAYEMKWDGIRAVVYVEGGRARAVSRNDLDVTGGYPELRALGEALGSRQVVLDGELVAFGPDGRVSFGALQQRMHVRGSQVRALARSVPVTYLVFDVLHLDGEPTLGLPYDERRALLEGLGLAGARWATPPVFVGGGADAMAVSKAQGLEGVVAKKRDSTYDPGRRSGCWVKVKHFLTQEVVLAGWKPGEGRRRGGIGSLVLGVYGDEGLTYVGNVGTGFTSAALADLERTLAPLEQAQSPFDVEVPKTHAKDVHWISPTLVGEVEFGNWTRDGRLRHPSWRGLRPDKRPEEVRVEPQGKG